MGASALVGALCLLRFWPGLCASPTAPLAKAPPEELRAKVKGTNRILTLVSDKDAIERSFGTKFRRGDSLQQTVRISYLQECAWCGTRLDAIESYKHLHLHEFDCGILTIGLSPSGHGSPSCPASRCLIKASIRLYPSQLNSASS